MARKAFQGTSFIIDRPKGTVKEWPQPDGGVKSFTYPCDYGYFPRLKGEDGEGLDAFVGDSPDGHFEVFQKLKPGKDGKMVLDETKFLVGVNDADRETIYRLYGDEVHSRRAFRDFEHLKEALEKFKPSKKDRYMEKKASVKEVLARYKLSDLKQADIDKVISGQVLGKVSPTTPLSHRIDKLIERNPRPNLAAVFGRPVADTKLDPLPPMDGLAAIKTATVFSSAFPALSAAMDSYSAVRQQEQQQELANQMAMYPGMMSTQPMMREMAMGNFDPSSLPAPTHHRHRRHHHQQ